MRFPVLLALPSLLAAQGATSLLQQADPFSCFTNVESDPGLVMTTVDVTGQPFAKAWRLRTASLAANPWERRLRCYNVNGTANGNKIVATFWARAADAPSGLGVVRFVVEENNSPHAKAAEKTVALTTQWRKFDVAFSAPANYTQASSYNLSFWVNFQLQSIEIGGFQILDHGPNANFATLGLANWPYEGAAAGAAWRAAAGERIERIRKRDYTFVARHASGAPLANERVRVRQKAHRFGFGTAVAACFLPGAPNPCGSAADRAVYGETVKQDFNKAVLENDLKWPQFELDNGARAAYGIDWLRQNGLPVRGHNLVWPGREYVPGDLGAFIDANNLSAARNRILTHIDQLTSRTAGKLTEWDVLNEPYHVTWLQDALCPGNRAACPDMAAWFQRARQGDPAAALYVNEYGLLEGGYDFQTIEGFSAIVSALRAAAPVDGIGLQAHFTSDLTSPERILQILDLLASRFGLPVQITEFDIDTRDEEVQARYTRDVLIAAFSHSSVSAFLNWGFWEGSHWRPNAAFYRRDWTRKPNGQAWRDLILSEWRTNQTIAADASGVVRFRGFLGDYDVTLENDGAALPPLAVDPGLVSVTVDTSPQNLKIAVDGLDYTAPRVFQWTPGSSHTIEAKTPQGLVPHAFSAWSQGGARLQTIATPQDAATYTAAFVESGGPAGSADPPSILEPAPDQTINVAGVTFRWSRNGTAREYDLRVADAATGAAVFTGRLAGSDATQTLISLGTGAYRFFVRACATLPAGRSCTAESERPFRVNLPAPTSAPTVTAPVPGAVFTTSTQTFQWTSVNGANTYDIELSGAASGETELRIAVPSTSLSTVYSMRGGQYRLRVRACSTACGPWSAQTAFTVNLPAVPSAAPSITATDLSPTNVLITYFTAVPGADLYRVLAIRPGAGPGGGALTTASVTTSQTQGTMRLPGGLARVIVAACNGNGCGPFSESVAMTPPLGNSSLPTLAEPVPGTVADGPAVLFSWSRVPGDDGSNTTYRLYVQDLSRQSAALDVLTTANFHAAGFRAEGSRYDATVIANPGPSQVQGPAVGFTVRGASPASPLVVQPRHESRLPGGNVQLSWTPVRGASLYQYYVAVLGESSAAATGITPGLLVQAPLPGSAAGTRYSAIVRACQAASCAAESDAGWGPWSIAGGTGVSNFTLLP